jgi:uncharacterized protein YraI
MKEAGMYRGILTAVMSALLSISLGNFSFAQTAFVNTERGVNLRSGAGLDHSVITAVSHHTQVRVLDKGNEWWQVEYNGHTGYIRSVYLTEEILHARSTAEPLNLDSSTGAYDPTSTHYAPHNWGIGFRLGDPSGLSVKRYLGRNAFELNIGQTYLWYARDGYRSRFIDWYRSSNFSYADYQYLGYAASSQIGLQLHYVFQNPIGRIGDASVNGLYWYYGLGGQLHYHRYSFDYRYRLPGSPAWYYATGGPVSDFDLGVDGLIGLEFKFGNTPISVFTDVALFMEIIDDPFLFWLQFGIGARFNF